MQTYEYLVQVSKDKEKRSMKKSINYTDAPVEFQDSLLHREVVKDFLPPSEHLIAKEETRKITIAISKHSVDSFKGAAEKNHSLSATHKKSARQLHRALRKINDANIHTYFRFS